MLHRRGFLAMATARVALGQAPPSSMPPPAKAKISSCAMLWTLAGTFEERVKTAALAGIQSVGITVEYMKWDDSALLRARRYVESFGMGVQTIASKPAGLPTAIRVAKQLDTPYIILTGGSLEDLKRAGELALSAEVTVLAEDLALVKSSDSARVRLLFNVFRAQAREGNVAAALREALEYTALVEVADSPGQGEPGTGSLDFHEIYRTLAKGGYTRTVAMEYMPKGDQAASLKRAVDQFRAVVNERGGPAAPTEGSFV